METFKVNNTEQISCAQNSTTSFLHFPARSHTVVVFRKAFEKQNAHMESALQILQCLHDLLNEDEAQTSDIWTSLPSGQDDHVSGLLQTSMALMKRLLADAQVKIY
ncbi:hypothetical protein M8J75_002301 [Diaphorina citri]|nr:hypothetical protein M8J75_002301 [Diaphorina citri]